MTAHSKPHPPPSPRPPGWSLSLCCEAEVTMLSQKQAESGESKGRDTVYTQQDNSNYSDVGENG